MKRLLPLSLLLLCIHLNAQRELPEPWITYPTASVTDYGVYHFRKQLEIDRVPGVLVVHVSADNRYHLYVNGEEVAYGPAKGDLQTYKYDVVDLAPYLKRGKNTLAALVYNHGKDRPMALLTVQTAFMLRSAETAWEQLNTDRSWRTYQNPAYSPVTYQEMLFDNRWFYGYYACGPGDRVDAQRHPWGWKTADFDDSDWQPAEALTFDGAPPWNLVERNIAFMDKYLERPVAVRQVTGAPEPRNFESGQSSWTVPANTRATLLLDYGILTMGYPDLVVRGGRGSSIQVKYAEALYERVNLKAHRDVVENKIMFGVWDVFQPDGPQRTFRPLWKRCFRYVQLVVETGDEPLEALSHSNEYSGYPYPEMATFESSDERLNRIFEMCLRTLRMCSGETYYDTPFYEQLSYGGDNRPIAANSIYNSTDDRLFREVMRLYPQSANPETLLFKSAYPSRFDFDMGSWSLAWVMTLDDYQRLRNDDAFSRPFVEDIEGVLNFYKRHLDESRGILGAVSNRNFMDWSITQGSLPRRDAKGEIEFSANLTLFFLHALDTTVNLYREINERDLANKWERLASTIRVSCKEQFWDEGQELLRDYPDDRIFSQHANILAILCDVVPQEEQRALLERVLESDVFTEYASSYFSYYLFKAMGKVGMEDAFVDHLDFWHEFLDKGFTTTGETGFASHDRSDCHAWAAHPSYYMLRYVAGIEPLDVGFERIRIEPHLGDLESLQISMPHQQGRIEAAYEQSGNRLVAEITLPGALKGIWVYKGEARDLQPGLNRIEVGR